MRKKTHRMIGMMATAPAMMLGCNPIIAMGIGAVSSVLADYDIPLGMKYRGVSHSPLVAFVSALEIGIVSLSPVIGLAWFLGYMSHIGLDSLTIIGVPLMYPCKKRMYGLRKFKTRGAIDDWKILYGIFVAGVVTVILVMEVFYRIIIRLIN